MTEYGVARVDQRLSSPDLSFLESLRGRLKLCPDTEPEQAMLRVVIGVHRIRLSL